LLYFFKHVRPPILGLYRDRVFMPHVIWHRLDRETLLFLLYQNSTSNKIFQQFHPRGMMIVAELT